MDAVLAVFRDIRDPRDSNARHPLPAMLFIALAATLCGAKSICAIADFAAAREALFAQIVDLPHGVPSHDCFSRVFRVLDPLEMEDAFARFVKALRLGLGLGPPSGVVDTDGKRMRGGYERGRAFMPPLMVGVFDAETRLSLAACHAPGGDEVAATLRILQTVVLKGCTVTADALHCHPRMAQTVLDQGADYALKLKGNNGPLHRLAKATFAEADARGDLADFAQRDAGHDRVEIRRASVVVPPPGASAFPGLAAFGRIESTRQTTGGKLEARVHYVVLSQKLSPRRMLEVTRSHWSIENHLHWQLDVVFHEDAARTRKDHAPENLSMLRRIALDILRSSPDKKSIARKMNCAAWSDTFFFSLFTQMQ